jgi:hypothetical protein
MNAPWKELFSESSKIDIISRFFDGPLRQNYSTLVRFFRRGGEVRVVTMDCRNDAAVQVANAQRNARGTHPEDIRIRAIASLQLLDSARIEAGAAPKALRVFLLPYPPNYSGYCFDDLVLLVSPTEHVFWEELRMPRLQIDLSLGSDFRKSWHHELEYLCGADHEAPDVTAYLASFSEESTRLRS